MKNGIILLINLILSTHSFATNQIPDLLEYDRMQFELLTGWGHPSPLQTYYFQNNINYPFQSYATNNYRGHIAVWKIIDNKLFLQEILTEKRRPLARRYVDWVMKRKGSISSSLYDYAHNIPYKKNKPSHFKVKSKGEIKNKNGTFADWFSGIIECELSDSTANFKQGTKFYFQIHEGNIIDKIKIEIGEKTKDIPLVRMLINYVTFYYRLQNDTIIYNDQKCLLNSDIQHLSPIFQHYENNVFKWTFNWENIEKSGAPRCTWLIKDNKIYLKELNLCYGLKFDSIDSERIDLNPEFKDEIQNEIVFANWISGIFLIFEGKVQEKDDPYFYDKFKRERYTFIEIKNGEIIRTYSEKCENSFVPQKVDPKFKRVFKEYY